ncbi:unnamed protein product, partial [Musa acuminata var. zebrina]
IGHNTDLEANGRRSAKKVNLTSLRKEKLRRLGHLNRFDSPARVGTAGSVSRPISPSLIGRASLS